MTQPNPQLHNNRSVRFAEYSSSNQAKQSQERNLKRHGFVQERTSWEALDFRGGSTSLSEAELQQACSHMTTHNIAAHFLAWRTRRKETLSWISVGDNLAPSIVHLGLIC